MYTFFGPLCIYIKSHKLRSLFNLALTLHINSRCSSVGIVTTLRAKILRNSGSVPSMVRLFASPKCSNCPWGPLNLLFNDYRGLFPQRQSSRGVKLATHFHTFNLLKTKHRRLYLKTQFVPRCKHFSSRL